MKCIYCGRNTRVINSRPQKRSNQIWRRRSCSSCGSVFTTLEATELTTSIFFKAKSGRLEPFSRDKLFLSIYNCLKHRKDAIDTAKYLTDTVMSKLRLKISKATIDRASVIRIATDVLKHFDKVACICYQAYHPL